MRKNEQETQPKKFKWSVSRGLQLGAAILETIFAIPVLGGVIIVGMLWIPLIFALALHIISLIFTIKEQRTKTAPVMGIIASTVGLIPMIGWVLHILAAVFNYVGAFKKD